MTLKICALILIFVANFRLCQSKKTYVNHTLFSIVATNMDQLKLLQTMGIKKYINPVFWQKPYRLYQDIHVVVNPIEKDLFLERLSHFKLSYNVVMDDLQKALNTQKVTRYTRLRTETFSWDHYYSLLDIYQWIRDLADRHPNMVSLEIIGKSTENRDIYAVGIKRSNYPRAKVIVEGGIHGHEWISIAFVTYLINELVDANRSKSAKFKYIANTYEWFLIPVVNPDGFEFTVKEDRLWRKNRKKYTNGFGVDLDRNFDYCFGKHDSTNVSSDDLYAGPLPHSEKETQALVKFIKSKRNKLKYYFSMHSYGQKIIIPFGDQLSHVGNYLEMENFARQAALKMYSKYGDRYMIGTTFDTLGAQVCGSSADYVKHNFKVEYVITWLMRDNGTFGFALPPYEIESTCEETLMGMVELMTAKLRYMRTDLYGDDSANNSPFVLLVFFTTYLVL